jgi:tyramine---L-glutamate ligase
MSGRSASLAIVAHPGKACILGGFEQRIAIDGTRPQASREVSYRGGAGPIAGIAMRDLERFASQVLSALPNGALGWIGIDFLIPTESQSWQDWIAIEVNPRLTTSYLGYQKWYGNGLAQRLIEESACTELDTQAFSRPVNFTV